MMNSSVIKIFAFWLVLMTLAVAESSSTYTKLAWEDLLEPSYQPDVLTKRFNEETKGLKKNDPRIDEISDKIGELFDTAPIDKSLDGKYVKLPGFVIPLEDGLGVVSEFLFVPDAGACIHVPPPPPNATILARTKGGKKISFTSSYDPYWIMGRLKIKKSKARSVGSEVMILDAMIVPISEEEDL